MIKNLFKLTFLLFVCLSVFSCSEEKENPSFSTFLEKYDNTYWVDNEEDEILWVNFNDALTFVSEVIIFPNSTKCSSIYEGDMAIGDRNQVIKIIENSVERLRIRIDVIDYPLDSRFLDFTVDGNILTYRGVLDDGHEMTTKLEKSAQINFNDLCK